MTTYADLAREINRGSRSDLIRDFVVAVAAEIADGRRQLRAVRHPLGFICLPVIRSGEDGVCVHAWPGGRAALAPTTSSMHSHSWDLLSHVLHGRVHNQIIEVTDTVTDPVFQVYEVHSHGDIDEIRATPRLVDARGNMVQTRRAGESYRLRAGRFHLTEVDPEQSTVTVALGRTVPGTADLSLGAIGGRNHQVRRRLCDPAETVALAGWIVRLISHSEGPAVDGGSGDI